MAEMDHQKLVGLAAAIQSAKKPYLTVDELASTLGVSVRTVRRWQAAGQGPGRTKWSRQFVHPLKAVGLWIEALETARVK